MALDRPNLTTLQQDIEADLLLSLGEAGLSPPDGDTQALADVLAGAMHAQYGYLANAVREIFPQTSRLFLGRWADLRSVLRKPATAATGTATATGTVGAVIPPGTLLRHGDLILTTTGGTVGVGGTVVIPLTASAGALGNIPGGTAIRFDVAIAGVRGEATVIAMAGGADLEDLEVWRARVMTALAQPPAGGAPHDYVRWALEVAGCTRAWVASHEMGVGSVTVRVMFDVVREGDFGIPTEGDIALVLDYLSDPSRRDVFGDLFVVAPVASPLDIEIQDLSPDTAAIRAAIQAQYVDLILREAVPGGPIHKSRMGEAISRAAGEGTHVLIMPDIVTHATGVIAVPGEITYSVSEE